MSSKTVKFTANTTWRSAAVGPLTITLNPVSGFCDIWVGANTANVSNEQPTTTANTFLLKPVAGENYVELTLESGDELWIRSRRDDATISWIQKLYTA